MASSSAPKHDFAPAWLKIPTNSGTHKPPRTANACSEREDDHWVPFARQRVALSPSPLTCSTYSSTSFERDRHQHHEHQARRDSASARQASYSLRHHSIDGEEYYHTTSLSTVNPVGVSTSAVNPNPSKQFGSQPILNRRPHSRQENRDSGGYSNYGGPYKGSNNYNFANDTHRSHWNRQRSFERSSNSRQNSGGGGGRGSLNLSLSGRAGSNSHRDRDRDREVNGPSTDKDPTVKFDQDFPSLGQGITSNSEGTIKVANGSVWDGARSSKTQLGGASDSNVKKMQLVQKPIRNGALEKRSASPSGGTGSGNGSPKLTSVTCKSVNSSQTPVCGTIYRALVPSKQGAVAKTTCKENGPVIKGSRSASPPAPAAAALNTRLVTHPKTVGDKKSDFLRTLRDDSITRVICGNEDGRNSQSDDPTPISPESPSADNYDRMTSEAGKCFNSLEECQDKDKVCEKGVKIVPYVNGIDSENVKGLSVKDMELSRSLEAEQRLLREMGWKGEGEEDEEVYAPLTEAEVKEFENLSKKRQVIRQRNGLHQMRNLHLTWSPKRVLMAFPKNLDLTLADDVDSSSSDTDSD